MIGGPAALMFVGAVWQSATDRPYLKAAAIIAALETALVVAAILFSVTSLFVA